LETGGIATISLSCDALSILTCFRFCKGIMWLLLATVAEIPPLVSSAYSFSRPFYAHLHVTSQVLIVLNLNGIVISFRCIDEESGLNSILPKFQNHLTWYVPDCHNAGDVLIPIHNTDLSASFSDNDDNCCDTHVSLPSRLCFFYHRDVQRFFLPSFTQC
jgi:hypothetical protein